MILFKNGYDVINSTTLNVCTYNDNIIYWTKFDRDWNIDIFFKSEYNPNFNLKVENCKYALVKWVVQYISLQVYIPHKGPALYSHSNMSPDLT